MLDNKKDDLRYINPKRKFPNQIPSNESVEGEESKEENKKEKKKKKIILKRK